jgi:hypothetical protein
MRRPADSIVRWRSALALANIANSTIIASPRTAPFSQ